MGRGRKGRVRARPPLPRPSVSRRRRSQATAPLRPALQPPPPAVEVKGMTGHNFPKSELIWAHYGYSGDVTVMFAHAICCSVSIRAAVVTER